MAVTGGSEGVGRAVAEGFAAEAPTSRFARNADEMAAAVEALKAKGIQAFGRAVDVADAEALKGWIAASVAELGGLDVPEQRLRMLCSVCADLRISSIFSVPNWVVSIYFPRIVLE